MGRLKTMPARVGSLPPRVRAMPKVADRFYQSPEWLAYRKAHRRWTMERQGGVWCVVCGSTHRLILDHRIERSDGGDDFPPYQMADWHCAACHNAKTARERAKRATGVR